MTKLLDYPGIYSGFRRLIAGRDLNAVLVSDYIRPDGPVRILDIGCGPASILSALPREVQYVGFDPNPAYIAAARSAHRSRGRFFEGLATPAALAGLGTFDIVLAIGVLHHLDQQQATDFIELARRACAPNGRLITLDGCYRSGQPRTARLLLRLDRGRYVRTQDGYVSIAETAFGKVKANVREDLLRIPYTHLILECQSPLPSPAS